MIRALLAYAAGLVWLAVLWAVVAPRVDAAGTPSDWALSRAVARGHGQAPMPCYAYAGSTYCPGALDRLSGESVTYRVRLRGACFDAEVVRYPGDVDEGLSSPLRTRGCVTLADQRPRIWDELLYDDSGQDPLPPDAPWPTAPDPAAAG